MKFLKMQNIIREYTLMQISTNQLNILYFKGVGSMDFKKKIYFINFIKFDVLIPFSFSI